MYPIVMAAAIAALLGAHLLRAPKRSGFMAAAMTFAAGLIAMAALIKFGTATLGFGRTTDFDRFVNHALETEREDDAPLVIFSGASFSRNAIDEERLTRALQARGYPHRVISLSLEAASLIERDTHLARFLKETPRAPDVVFIEIAEVTDKRPTFIFGNSKFSTRAIDQYSARGAAWSALGLAGGACQGAADCVKEGGLVAVHALLSAANVGLIGQGEPTAAVEAKAAFDGPLKAREDIDAARRAKSLSEHEIIAPRDGLNWAKNFRKLQAGRLATAGVRRTGYYFPPVIEPGPRAYAAGLCIGELKGAVCITGEDPQLLLALDKPVWLDREHLLDPGTEIYTEWLADKIAASGILGSPK